MSIELQLMINVIVSTMPYCILAYCPMLKYLRYKKWLVGIVIIISEFVFVNSSLIFLKNGINPRYSDVITSVICLIAYALCVKVDFFKLVFFYFFHSGIYNDYKRFVSIYYRAYFSRFNFILLNRKQYYTDCILYACTSAYTYFL